MAKKSTKRRGDMLEDAVYQYFKREIEENRFWASKERCRIFQKKKYFSRDRGSMIEVDVSIELYLPDADEYSSVVLIECKNYTHSVPVDDTEEFFAKVQQIAAANSKAVLVSTGAFQSGTRSYATAKGIGLLRYFSPEQVKWELRRSPSSSYGNSSSSSAVSVALSDPAFVSNHFDFYCQSPRRDTNSIRDFFEDLVSDAGLEPDELALVRNRQSPQTVRVQYIERKVLEELGESIVRGASYGRGIVSLDEICDIEAKRSGLVVNTDVVPSLGSGVGVTPLGAIRFDPLEISIFKTVSQNRERERFTLAHELAHYFLDHGRYIGRESCDEGDITGVVGVDIDSSEISRLEFQANFLAASILMPWHTFFADFRTLLEYAGVPQKRHGALYVDDQPCNLQTYMYVTSHLMREYGVSRAAVKIRLQALDLLHDVRSGQRMRMTAGDLVDIRSFFADGE